MESTYEVNFKLRYSCKDKYGLQGSFCLFCERRAAALGWQSANNCWISLGYLWDIFGISWGYLGEIFGISLGNLCDIFGISLGYLWDMLGISCRAHSAFSVKGERQHWVELHSIALGWQSANNCWMNVDLLPIKLLYLLNVCVSMVHLQLVRVDVHHLLLT